MTPRTAMEIAAAAQRWSNARARRLAFAKALRRAEAAKEEQRRAAVHSGNYADYVRLFDRVTLVSKAREHAKREETAALRELAKLCPIERDLPMADVVVHLSSGAQQCP